VRTGGRFFPIDGRSVSLLSPAVLLTALSLIVTAALVFLHRMGPPQDPQAILVLQVTEQVESDQASMVGTDDVTLYIPAHSIPEDGTLSIRRVEPDQIPVSDDIWTRPVVVLIEFMDADGRPVPDLRFLNRVEVCFRLTEEEWADSIRRPTSYQVQFYPPREQPAYWNVLLMSTHDENLELCGLATRLGMFALAIEVEPQIPITGLTAAVLPASSTPREDVEPAPTRNRERPTPTPPPSTSTPQPPPPTEPPPPADTPRPREPGPPTDRPNPPDPGPPNDGPNPPDPGPPNDGPNPPNPGGPPNDGPNPPDPGPPNDGPNPPNPGGPPSNPGRP
jgi:hypothetical protein